MTPRRPRHRTLALVTFVLMGGAAGWLVRNHGVSSAGTETRRWDLSDLTPGTEKVVPFGAHSLRLSIPSGEGSSFGTLGVEMAEVGFAAPGIERDGSLESVWFADVNGDGIEDGVFVVRSAGSGGYANLMVLESDAASFRIRVLPPIEGVPGHMGHETIQVREGEIRCAFPTYIDGGGPRIDRQWEPKDALNGETPITSGSDSNADPSGVTVELRFDYAAGRWEPG